VNQPRPVVVLGDDGISRCAWSTGDEEYRRYHDEEWGVELRGDRPLFEKAAFHDFDIDLVAALTEPDVDRLMLDGGIIRNRAKIEATIANAGIVRQLVQDDPGAFDRLLWGFATPRGSRPRPVNFGDIPAVTAESTALSRELRAIGLRFVGPTTTYALMQSSGMVDDHVEGCWRAA